MARRSARRPSSLRGCIDHRGAHLFARLRRGLERLAARPLGAVVLFVVALGVYAIQAVAWPLKAGRDLDEYLYAYVQLFDRHVLLPWSMLFRTPLTPLVTGVFLDIGGGVLAEPVPALLYAGSIVAWAAVGLLRSAGGARNERGPARLSRLRADVPRVRERDRVRCGVRAVGAPRNACRRPPVARALHARRARDRAPGTRSAGQRRARRLRPLPVHPARRWSQRLAGLQPLSLATFSPSSAWAVHNGLRFGDYTLARGGNAVIPFYRAFITDRIVSPENGDASRRLGDAVQKHLLTRDPYRSYGVTLDDVFSTGSFRIHEDLYLLSDQVFGWDSDYRVLRDAGIEGVRAHPGTYASGVLGTVWSQLAKPYYRASPRRARRSRRGADDRRERPPAACADRRPADPGGSGRLDLAARPEAIRQVWTSPTEWHLEFAHPADKLRRENREEDGPSSSPDSRTGLATRHSRHASIRPHAGTQDPCLWLLLGASRSRFAGRDCGASSSPSRSPRFVVVFPTPSASSPTRTSCFRSLRRSSCSASPVFSGSAARGQ